MKKNIYLLIILLSLVGCKDFLEETSQDLVRPSQVTDLEQILLGDGYGSPYYSTTIFTDEQASTNLDDESFQSTYDELKWLYTWNKDMFTDAGAGYFHCFWEMPYRRILGCNLVLDYLDEMAGKEVLRESLRGEALVLRAWNYFHLVNMFGIAYSQGNPSTDLGVPLKLDATVNGDFYTRNTVAEVYARIEKDLLDGNRLLMENRYERTFYRIDHLAAKAMLSRVYLYMENWDKALAYADSVLILKSDLLDLNNFSMDVYNTSGTGSVYLATAPDEIIWARNYLTGYSLSSSVIAWVIGPFVVSQELIGRYEQGAFADISAKRVRDLRAFFYFTFGMDIWGLQWDMRESIAKGGSSSYIQGIRTAELYLNRAEAYTQKFLKEGNDAYRNQALTDLNKLRKYRFNKEFPADELNITDGQELLEFIIDERFRELCGETNHRWCDLRRYGLTVTHVLKPEGQTYSQDMRHYVLPIPELVLEQNPYLVQN